MAKEKFRLFTNTSFEIYVEYKKKSAPYLRDFVCFTLIKKKKKSSCLINIMISHTLSSGVKGSVFLIVIFKNCNWFLCHFDFFFLIAFSLFCLGVYRQELS